MDVLKFLQTYIRRKQIFYDVINNLNKRGKGIIDPLLLQAYINQVRKQHIENRDSHSTNTDLDFKARAVDRFIKTDMTAENFYKQLEQSLLRRSSRKRSRASSPH